MRSTQPPSTPCGSCNRSRFPPGFPLTLDRANVPTTPVKRYQGDSVFAVVPPRKHAASPRVMVTYLSFLSTERIAGPESVPPLETHCDIP